MRRAALLRRLHASASAKALPALSDAPAPRSGGLLASLLGRPAPAVPSMLEPLSLGAPAPPYTPPAHPPVTEAKKLANGALLAAEETPVRGRASFVVRRGSEQLQQSLFCFDRTAPALIRRPSAQGATLALGVYVDAGSKYETAATTGASARRAAPVPPLTPAPPGASHVLERLAFKATQHRSAFRLTREARARAPSLPPPLCPCSLNTPARRTPPPPPPSRAHSGRGDRRVAAVRGFAGADVVHGGLPAHAHAGGCGAAA